MRKKIVLMTGGTETLDYFSRQLEIGFILLGYQTFLFDLQQEEESAEKLAHFAGISDTILVTFNFDGLCVETSLYDAAGNIFWDIRDIPCVNIVVDHPIFYPKLYEQLPRKYHEVSIDRSHMAYLQKYYPEVKSNIFLPLGGTALHPGKSYPSVEEREIDVLFTGNYTPKEQFEQYIHRNGEEYATFYLGILNELIGHPALQDDLVMEKHLKREFPEATNTELRTTMSNMLFIDTYIRNYFRAKVIQTLVDAKIHVHCIGHGWNLLECKHKEYLSYEKNQYSLACLERMNASKISINVMPWFKDGAHDRVFNAMANGSVCITDHSKYLDEILTDGENVIFYDLEHLEELPDKVRRILKQPDKMKTLSDNGFAFVQKSHTWIQRAKELHEKLLQNL